MTEALLRETDILHIHSNDLNGSPFAIEYMESSPLSSYDGWVWKGRRDFKKAKEVTQSASASPRDKGKAFLLRFCLCYSGRIAHYGYSYQNDIVRMVANDYILNCNENTINDVVGVEFPHIGSSAPIKTRRRILTRKMGGGRLPIHLFTAIGHIRDMATRLKRSEIKRIIPTAIDYTQLDIEPNSLVYCDPPYVGTEGYGYEFNHDEFYLWCERLVEDKRCNVYVSETTCPSHWREVWQKQIRINMAKNSARRLEKLFRVKAK